MSHIPMFNIFKKIEECLNKAGENGSRFLLFDKCKFLKWLAPSTQKYYNDSLIRYIQTQLHGKGFVVPMGGTTVYRKIF